MDGYHLTRAQLSAMPDPETAHSRRGAAFTFNPSSLLSLVTLLRAPLTATTPIYYAPSFDHAIKDPVDNDILIPPTSRILLFEGNYLSLGKGEWKEITELMDELWFMEVEEEVAGKRLVPRHLKAGIVTSEEEAWKRVWENDLVNGREIVEGRVEVSEVVVSREDEEWKPKV
jgi:pantothenate kinase